MEDDLNDGHQNLSCMVALCEVMVVLENSDSFRRSELRYKVVRWKGVKVKKRRLICPLWHIFLYDRSSIVTETNKLTSQPSATSSERLGRGLKRGTVLNLELKSMKKL